MTEVFMYDEIMQELWPKFEADVKKYAEHGPFLAKIGWGETRAEALKRLKKYAKAAKAKKQPEEMKRLIFREVVLLVYMLYHITRIHKDKCGCSYCALFGRLLRMFYEGAKKDKVHFFFNTAKKFDGDIGFRLSNYA
jgi:ribosomal protein S26